jgi:hypothetical protein
VEDLFKETPAAPTPAPPGAAPAAAETPPAAETPAAAETPPAEGEKKADSVDDLFKETSEPKPSASEPAAAPAAAPEAAPTQPEEPAKAGKVEDLFNDPAAKQDKSASADSPNAMRLWTDNTGKYHVTARLVMVSQTHVRLLKDTGKFTTVPFERLSHADLAFVRQHWAGVIAGR